MSDNHYDEVLEITVVCTDRGQHATAQIARFAWGPEMVDGYVVADPEAPTILTNLDSVRDDTRTTTAGDTRVISRLPVTVEDRADGGHTFVTAPCQRCRRTFRIRDTSLRKLRDAKRATVDWSLI